MKFLIVLWIGFILHGCGATDCESKSFTMHSGWKTNSERYEHLECDLEAKTLAYEVETEVLWRSENPKIKITDQCRSARLEWVAFSKDNDFLIDEYENPALRSQADAQRDKIKKECTRG